MRTEVLQTLGYIAILIASVASALVALRWGIPAFGSTWVLGALLTMGWGTTSLALLDPSLPARLWTIPYRDGARASWRSLAVGTGVCALVAVVPVLSNVVSAFAGTQAGWVLVFVWIGMARYAVQVMTTLLVRESLHNQLLVAQGIGRVAEIAWLGMSCWWSDTRMFVVSWLVYPGLQAFALVAARRQRGRPETTAAQRGCSWNRERASGELSNVVLSLLDIVVPTLWLRLGGEAAYVVYRAMISAVGYVVLLPRYWYVVAESSAAAPRGTVRFALSVMAVSVTVAVGYQWLTRVVPVEAMLWAVIPVLFSSGSAPHYSRLRQGCLRRGDIASPAISAVAGRIAELLLLVLLAGAFRAPGHVTVLAYCGTAVSAVVLDRQVARSANRDDSRV